MTSRGPLSLAALASAAVPGLDPSTVEGVVGTRPARPFDVAFVQDHEHRRWVIRCPRTPAASAQLEQSAALLTLLSRRLTMPVPSVKGWAALPEGGRAAVHTYLTGRMVDLESIAPGSKLAVGLGRALAQLHNLDRRVYEEAGVPVYEAEAYRTRRLAELDRAAATGRVPTGLLTRWEHTLEDLSLWRFTTTPTHGAIGASTILATPDDGDQPDVKGFLGWESAQVADPADDLAVLVAELHPDSLDTVLEAYAHARADRPDRYLQQRARLVHEMQLVRSMMSAVASGDDLGAEGLATQLRRLDDRLAAEDEAAEAKAASDKVASDKVAVAAPAAHSTSDESTSGAAETELAQPESTETAPVSVTQDKTSPTAVTQDETGTVEAEPTDTGKGATALTEVKPTAETQPTTETQPTAETQTDGLPTADDEAPVVEVARPVTVTPVTEESGTQVAAPRQGNDHETAEITPINDDDGDDIIPVTPRR